MERNPQIWTKLNGIPNPNPSPLCRITRSQFFSDHPFLLRRWLSFLTETPYTARERASERAKATHKERERERDRQIERERKRERVRERDGEWGIRCGRVQRWIDRLGSEEKRVVVAREDTWTRRTRHFASHLPSLWDSRQAPRKGGC